MTWFWFALFGIIALASRTSVSNWVATWSDSGLKLCATVGLVGFGCMATFGLIAPTEAWLLHLAAGIGGVLGFFAVNEIANRGAANRQVSYQAKLRNRLDEYRSQQRAMTRKPQNERGEAPRPDLAAPQPRRDPPLIKVNDSQENILDLLAAAAENWESPEVDTGTTTRAPEEAKHQTYQSMAEIRARAAGTQQTPAVEITDAPVIAQRPTEHPPAGTLDHLSRETDDVQAVQGSLEPVLESNNKIASERETPSNESVEDEHLVGGQEEPGEHADGEKHPMSRESGPISLVKSAPIRPPGPISLAPPAATEPARISSTGQPEGFVYQPKLVRSRLSGTTSATESVGSNATEESAEDEQKPATEGTTAASA